MSDDLPDKAIDLGEADHEPSEDLYFETDLPGGRYRFVAIPVAVPEEPGLAERLREAFLDEGYEIPHTVCAYICGDLKLRSELDDDQRDPDDVWQCRCGKDAYGPHDTCIAAYNDHIADLEARLAEAEQRADLVEIDEDSLRRWLGDYRAYVPFAQLASEICATFGVSPMPTVEELYEALGVSCNEWTYTTRRAERLLAMGFRPAAEAPTEETE